MPEADDDRATFAGCWGGAGGGWLLRLLRNCPPLNSQLVYGYVLRGRLGVRDPVCRQDAEPHVLGIGVVGGFERERRFRRPHGECLPRLTTIGASLDDVGGAAVSSAGRIVPRKHRAPHGDTLRIGALDLRDLKVLPKFHVFRMVEEAEPPEGFERIRLGDTALLQRQERIKPIDEPDRFFTTIKLSQNGEMSPREAGKGNNPPEVRRVFR
jgi:hypothetical protein